VAALAVVASLIAPWELHRYSASIIRLGIALSLLTVVAGIVTVYFVSRLYASTLSRVENLSASDFSRVAVFVGYPDANPTVVAVHIREILQYYVTLVLIQCALAATSLKCEGLLLSLLGALRTVFTAERIAEYKSEAQACMIFHALKHHEPYDTKLLKSTRRTGASRALVLLQAAARLIGARERANKVAQANSVVPVMRSGHLKLQGTSDGDSETVTCVSSSTGNSPPDKPNSRGDGGKTVSKRRTSKVLPEVAPLEAPTTVLARSASSSTSSPATSRRVHRPSKQLPVTPREPVPSEASAATPSAVTGAVASSNPVTVTGWQQRLGSAPTGSHSPVSRTVAPSEPSQRKSSALRQAVEAT
jgi:hypothetical protein